MEVDVVDGFGHGVEDELEHVTMEIVWDEVLRTTVMRMSTEGGSPVVLEAQLGKSPMLKLLLLEDA